MSSKSSRQQNPFLFPIPGLRSGGIKHEYITEIGKGLPEKNLKTNKFDLFSDMLGKSDYNEYDAIWDLNISNN